MSETTFKNFDQSELLALALQAARQGDAGSSFALAKEAASRPDASATAHFLLGSEYAQMQLYDRAAEEMETAIAIEPSFAIGRFQLGLLLLSSGKVDRAIDILTPLTVIGQQEPLAHFANGLLHLANNAFSDALRCLTIGIEMNVVNDALNVDMKKIIDQIVLATAPTSGDPATEPEAESLDLRHIFISAYTGNGNN